MTTTADGTLSYWRTFLINKQCAKHSYLHIGHAYHKHIIPMKNKFNGGLFLLQDEDVVTIRYIAVYINYL